MQHNTPLEFHEVANIFPMMNDEEYRELVADIREHGQHEPIWTYEGEIIDGRNRYRACQEIGIDPLTHEWDGSGSLVAFVVSLNLKRRHLSSSQKAVIALEVEPLLAEEAEQRRRESISHYRQTGETVQRIEPSQKSVEQAAAITGTNRQYVSDVKKIANTAPELVEEIRNGTISIPEAKSLANQPQELRDAALDRKKSGEAKSAQQAIRESITFDFAGIIPTPTEFYRCIVIDPPWDMQKIERDVRPNQAAFDYPTMNEDQLADLPVFDLADEQCHLYIWTTHKYLPMALRLCEIWGFHYQCLMTWRKNGGPTPFSWMYSTEHVLFCRRGNLPLLQMGRRLDFEGQRREHSRKPDVFYDLVREVSPGPRLDMFARERREGFEVWGNEVDRFTNEVADAAVS